ncbi:hypothetical protein Tco_1155724 [Tanacetum coccineum]
MSASHGTNSGDSLRAACTEFYVRSSWSSYSELQEEHGASFVCYADKSQTRIRPRLCADSGPAAILQEQANLQAPYRMAPIELKELKDHCKSCWSEVFNPPIVSPWGAPVMILDKRKLISKFSSANFGLSRVAFFCANDSFIRGDYHGSAKNLDKQDRSSEVIVMHPMAGHLVSVRKDPALERHFLLFERIFSISRFAESPAESSKLHGSRSVRFSSETDGTYQNVRFRHCRTCERHRKCFKMDRNWDTTSKCRASLSVGIQVGERVLEVPEMIEVTNENVAVATGKS